MPLHPHVTAQQELTVPSWTANPRTVALVDVYAAATAEVGYSVQTQARGGGSDGNGLWEKWPTIDGPGPSDANAHCSALLPLPPPAVASDGDDLEACAVEADHETRVRRVELLCDESYDWRGHDREAAG